MINTSNAYKNTIKENRVIHNQVRITFADGSIKTAADTGLLQFGITDETSNNSSFDIGSAIAKQITVKINNTDGELTKKNFSGAELSAKVGLEVNGTVEWLDKGTFYAEPGKDTGDTVTVSAFDKMLSFDQPYTKSKLAYPVTLREILQDACTCCDVPLAADTATFDNSDLTVESRPDDSALTFRQIIQWVAQIACKYARINNDGQLTLKWYDTSLLGLSVSDMQNNNRIVKIDTMKSGSSVETDDVVVTGVRVTEESETESSGKTETIYQYGADGYVLEITGNKLIQSGNGSKIAESVGKKLTGLQFRPLNVICQSDPSTEAGDIGLVIDRKNNMYRTIITGVQYNGGGTQTITSSAESPERLSSTRYSEATKLYKQFRNGLSKNKTEWEKAMEQLTKAMKEQVGLYPVIKTLEDGSKIYYMCDHPTLEESKVVFELNGKGWAVSTDGGNTWNAGLLVDGTMITKILNSIGINADWINTGALVVKDTNGDTLFRADIDTGQVYINATTLKITGKDVEEIAQDSAKKYVTTVVDDIAKDINTQYFGAYDPGLTNLPAKEWTDIETKDKHVNDLFYNTDTKKLFRFIKDGENYTWEDFQDSEIQKALEDAATAKDTADGKRRVFINTPTPPYDEGDMWVTSMEDGKGKVKICKTARESGTFVSTDWIFPGYVDSNDVQDAIDNYDNSLGQPEIFNKLTNNGKNKGIYIQDGELYINASYILSGVLAGKFINGKGMSVTDKENKTTFYIDNDGNVMIAAKTLTIGGKDVEDIAGDTIDEKIKKAIPLVIQLSSEYQAIPVNADGNYSSFPRCEVKVQVFYGESDVTSEAAISYSTENITGTWSSGTHTYSVKSLSEDIGWVDFSTTYNGITITKRFNLAKQYAGGNGTNGKDATVYYLECETTTIKRCSNSSGGYDYSPSPLVFHLYSQTGAEERKQNISGRWTFEYTEDGSAWNAISGTGVGIDMKFSAWDRITNRTTAIRCTVGNSSGVILGMLSVSVLADAEVTREAVFNALTDNGDRQLIAYGSDGKLYINGEYIKSKTITADLIDVNTLDAIVAKIGGFVVGSSSIHTSGRNSMTSTTQGIYIGTNGFSVYKDARNYFNMNTGVGLQIKGGTIKLGNVTLAEASDKKSLSVKYGMQVHTQRSSGEFTDGSGEFKLINLTTVSSGYQTLCIASNIVYKLSSSSKRYKNHVRNMDSSEADKLLKVPVVWFQYKKGYLREGDPFEDKPVPGFYAEDVYKQYPEGVIFNEDGQIEDWNYRTMIPAMMKVIQNQNERINTLEDTVSTLNERLSKLEEMLKGVVK
mgnify:FL=1